MSAGHPRRWSRLAAAIGSLLLASGPALCGEETRALGRLFFTAERRAQLDRQREMNTLDKQQASSDPTLTIDGVVVRSSGRRTVWVNGRPQHENDLWSGLTVSSRRAEPGTVLIEAGDSPAARAQVGETLSRDSGKSSDLLNGGRLRVHAQP